MHNKKIKGDAHPNNPMHGVKLIDILEALENYYGWDELDRRIRINCFHSNPSIKSCLKFLRKTPWARAKVEKLYLEMIQQRELTKD